ncbi:cytochrome c oxidase assembly factor 8 isoform X2 [Octopus bimaculoides]|uniref:Cytochrome c oxidase assembly factor 8 n=1 Tax=Octopus bimaculoides TaxID=37653 RepID=A0A0L8HM13_OCTBM|nr:cytochrome c oxidase assembly factor 8 isoform X2 [Octopus bimaculoides]|eukprot:XP_014771303.1 PREDICTED: apoptogenic protein 1, mitochondrial-like isoform X3 [Octopus bimaculoides]
MKQAPLTTKKKKKETFKLSSSPPKSITRNWIGPPDGNSNLRPTHFYIPPNESNVEKDLRLKKVDLQTFNHDFWTRQNITFFKRKAQFIHMELERKKQIDSDNKNKKSLSPEEMAVFYKQFLEENYQNNLKYHREWYKKNIFLLWPALKVAVHNLFKKAK